MTIYHYRPEADQWLEGRPETGGPVGRDSRARLEDLLDRLLPLLNTSKPRWAQRIEKLREDFDRQGTTVVFGGHFKSGKSTLLNALLERAILPVDALPETGALCVLRSASVDRAQVFDGDGSREVLCETEAIRQEVALLDEWGQQRSQIEEVDRLELDLAGVSIPADQCWIDSPGINDTEAMNRCARRAAREGDLLVWVLTSKQMLAEVEVAFLAEEIAHSGPASVVFLLNFFLADDEVEEWRGGLEKQLPFLLEKVAELSADLGFTEIQPPVVAAVAGRALGSGAEGVFGGLEIRDLLFDQEPGLVARRDRARLHRSLITLQKIQRKHARILAGEEQVLAKDQEAYAARRAAAEKDRKSFKRELRQAFDRLRGDWRAGIDAAAEEVASTVAEPLARDDTYGRRLDEALAAFAENARRKFQRTVAAAARRHLQSPLPESARKQIHRALTPSQVEVQVANHSVESKGLVGGALAGAAAGSVVPLIGTLLGGIVGAAAGAGVSVQAAIDKDIADTRIHLRRARRPAKTLVDRKEKKIRQTILRHTRREVEGPYAGHEVAVERSREVARLLAQAIEETRTLATDSL